jgi:hypothetical protein
MRKTALEEPALHQQQRQLRAIQGLAVSQYRKQKFGWPAPITGNPALDRAKAIFTLVGALALLAAFFLQVSAFAALILAILLATAGGCLTYNQYPYRTRTQQLYGLLAAYNPINQPAYQQLQAKDRNETLYWDDILKWSYIEQGALAQSNRPTTQPGNAERSRFLRKFDSP